MSRSFTEYLCSMQWLRDPGSFYLVALPFCSFEIILVISRWQTGEMSSEKNPETDSLHMSLLLTFHWPEWVVWGSRVIVRKAEKYEKLPCMGISLCHGNQHTGRHSSIIKSFILLILIRDHCEPGSRLGTGEKNTNKKSKFLPLMYWLIVMWGVDKRLGIDNARGCMLRWVSRENPGSVYEIH